MAKRTGTYFGGSTIIRIWSNQNEHIRASELKALKAEMKERYGHMTKEEFIKEFPKKCPNMAPTQKRAAEMYDYIFG